MAVMDTYERANMYDALERFKKTIKVGDWFDIPLEHLAIVAGTPLLERMIFEVKAMYPNYVIVESPFPKDAFSKQAITYVNLFMYADAM